MAKKREAEKFLEEHGFALYRTNGKHHIYIDEIGQRVTAHCTLSDWRGQKNHEARVRRKVRYREEALAKRREEEMKILIRSGQDGSTKVIERSGYRESGDEPPLRNSLGPILANALSKPGVPEPKPDKPSSHRAPEWKGNPEHGGRWEPDYKAAVGMRILELHYENKSFHEIAAQMTKEGYKSGRGLELSPSHVRNIYVELERTTRPAESGYTKPAPEEPKVNTPSFEIEEPKEQKMVQIVKEAPEPKKLPDFVLAILKDASLSDSKKIKMLLLYAED